MCHVYSGTRPAEYQQVTRSVRLHRAVTSIRLETRFWTILDRMAAQEGMTTPRFLAVLHDEVLELYGEVRNFASLLRVACTTYLARKGELAAEELEPPGERPYRATPELVAQGSGAAARWR
jgi:predicted DNA-binding ribbon-helix-helix protein